MDKVTKSGIDPVFYTLPDGKVTAEDLMAKLTSSSTFEVLRLLISAMFDECKYMMDDKEFLDKVRQMKFDMMLVDGFFLAPCRFILPYHLGVPYIYEFTAKQDWMIGIPALPSFHPYPDFSNSVFLSDKMNFGERVLNFFLALMYNCMIPFPFTSDDSLLHEYAPGKTWEDLTRQSELFLVTRDHMLEYPTVELPNVITVPGITVGPAKPLPADLEEIYKKAEYGVVVVSFGSLFQEASTEVVDSLFAAFSQLKQIVIMRYVGDIEGARKKAPSNVYLLSWLPQNDMLGHEKTVAFVTHCGNNGVYESLYHGVPMVGAPIMSEQYHNAFLLVDRGYGLKVSGLNDFTSTELFEALSEVTKNPKYRQQIKHASSIIKAQKMLPKAKLAFWVDHVMNFGGKHLRSASQDLPVYKLFMLDVWGFFSLTIVISVYLLRLVTRKYCKKRITKSKGD